MKNFTKKIFMLSAAMLLSVGAFAQSDGIAHRFPAVTFTADIDVYGTTETLTFTLPAWDAYNSDKDQGGYRR